MITARELEAPYAYVMSENLMEPVERLLLATGRRDACTSVVLCGDGTRCHSLMELEGLGKEIWAGEDAQAYVNRLRDEWSR
jgi:hypothetical protein